MVLSMASTRDLTISTSRSVRPPWYWASYDMPTSAMLPATTASASSSSLSFSTSSLTSSLRRRASSTVLTPAGCTVTEGMALAVGDCVACGVAEGITLALGAGLGRVSALLAQAENSARPSREITTRVQVFFNAVRLLAAIVCRSGEANVRQLFPAGGA